MIPERFALFFAALVIGMDDDRSLPFRGFRVATPSTISGLSVVPWNGMYVGFYGKSK